MQSLRPGDPPFILSGEQLRTTPHLQGWGDRAKEACPLPQTPRARA